MKKFLITILIALALASGIYISQRYNPVPGQSGVTETTRPDVPFTDSDQPIATPWVGEDYVIYRGEDGKNAFEVLQSVTKVEFKKYDFGVFVESIGGAKPDSKHFWKFYLNGKESQVGADQVQTKPGDVIEWKLEEIE